MFFSFPTTNFSNLILKGLNYTADGIIKVCDKLEEQHQEMVVMLYEHLAKDIENFFVPGNVYSYGYDPANIKKIFDKHEIVDGSYSHFYDNRLCYYYDILLQSITKKHYTIIIPIKYAVKARIINDLWWPANPKNTQINKTVTGFNPILLKAPNLSGRLNKESNLILDSDFHIHDLSSKETKNFIVLGIERGEVADKEIFKSFMALIKDKKIEVPVIKILYKDKIMYMILNFTQSFAPELFFKSLT